MIEIVKGDLLKSKENIIAHQVNCMGVMGSGVAKQIRTKYPLVFQEYRNLVLEYTIGNDLRKSLLGRVQGVKVGKKTYVANMFSQHNYGHDGKQYTNTEALFKCLKSICDTAHRHELSVAMPYMIGCYRGGADWKEVENLLLTVFDGYKVKLYKLK